MPAHRHIVYADFEAVWENELRPWFAARGRNAWVSAKPVVVTCPHGGLVALLKERLLKAHIPALGIHFTTPGSLRSLLLPLLEDPTRLALREDLHLLARLAAAELGDEPVAQSVLADPSALIRALDTLESAGWTAKDMPLPEARAMAERVQGLLSACGLQTVAQLDGRLQQQAVSAPKELGDWLAVGFSSADWTDFALLNAAFASSEFATLCFLAEGERPVSAAWTGVWEALAGPVDALWDASTESPVRLLSVADAFQGRMEGKSEAARFIVTQNQGTEARSVVHQLLGTLEERPGSRIGIVVPPGGKGIAREITLLLAESGLPHQDCLGHRPAKVPSHRLFQSWVALQRDQSLPGLLAFAKCLREVNPFPAARYRDLERASQKAFFELMSDQLGPLCAHSALTSSALTTFLRDWPLLPQEAVLEAFVELTLPQLERIGWPEDRQALLERMRPLVRGLEGTSLSRSAYLQWLAELADIPGRSRHERAREPFAPIQVLTLREAAGQPWDTLILAGMTQGEWPPELPESPYLPEQTIASLNASALEQGAQGEGHLVVKNGRSLIPGRAQEALRCEDSLGLLLGMTRDSLTATVSLRDPASPSLRQPVSEWFLRLYAASRGVWPSPQVLDEHASGDESRYGKPDEEQRFAEVSAAEARRCDDTRPFDAYTYSLEEPPTAGLLLSASVWGRLFKNPVSVWYEHILRAGPPFDPSHESPSARARGTWMHQWLRPAEVDWQTLPAAKPWQESVRKNALKTRREVAEAYCAAGRALPEWWLAHWSAALNLALGFATRLSEGALGLKAAGEWTLPQGNYTLLAGKPGVPLKGRIDLLLADQVPHPEDETKPLPQVLTVVDYKTGADKPLSERGLSKGEGIQLALYALACREYFGVPTQAIMLTSAAEFAVQLNSDELEAVEPLWDCVTDIAGTGRIGDWPQSSFGHTAPRPLADRPLPDAILRAKWALTHPGVMPS